MFNIPGIILIDNEESELLKMQDAFFKAGFPCLPIKYENNDPTNISGIDHVTIPESLEPRIIVSDLNLKDLTKLDATTLCAPIAKIIHKLIKSGPYMLWIWSKHPKEPLEVVSLLEQRYKNRITLPLRLVSIDKNAFLSEETAEKLKSKIIELLNTSSVFDALWDWEGRIAIAARKTVTALHELTKPEGDYTIEKHNENLQKTLAKIGNETLGPDNAIEFPTLAMDLGLAPVLADQLLSITDKTRNDIWKVATPDLGKKFDIDSDVKSKLNSFFHVDNVAENFPKDYRGVLLLLNYEYLNEKTNATKFENRIGKAINKIIIEEFFNDEKGGEAKRADREKAIQEIKLGFLELSAECDHAQKKTKLHRYILAALIPSSHEEYTYFGGKPPKTKLHDGIYRLPAINHQGSTYILKLSFKYQIGAKPDDNKWLGNPVLRIRDQILADITFNCAQYSSRPGIIKFD